MSYEIEDFGPSNDTGVRAKSYNAPTFPPNYPAGKEVLRFTDDIRTDPAGDSDDPVVGWDAPGTRVSEV